MVAQVSEFRSKESCAIVSSIRTTVETNNVTSLYPEQLVQSKIIEAIAKGNESALEQLYDAAVHQVYSLALRITRQQDMAEEVVSDVFLQIWQQAARFDSSRGNVMAWIMVICRTRALDAIRRNKNIEEKEVSTDEDFAETDEDPQNLLAAVDQQSAVYDALMELNESQRQLLALAFFRGYTHSELAEFTGLPLGTVKSHLRRALQNLKEIMERSKRYAGAV